MTGSDVVSPSRFLSAEECAVLYQRVKRFATPIDPRRSIVHGGGLIVAVESTWGGTTRWARNRISTADDVQESAVQISHGGSARTNQLDDEGLAWTVRRAERLGRSSVIQIAENTLAVVVPEPIARPEIWSDATYQLEAEARAEAMRALVRDAEAAGLLTSGYIRTSAAGRALMDDRGHDLLYYPYTHAQYSVTVRSPDGSGSGWAGQDHHDWAKIDAAALTARALEKCLASRNPVAVEPGRYTSILEPQAVCDLSQGLFGHMQADYFLNDANPWIGPFTRDAADGTGGRIRFQERVWDDRLGVRADPTDPDGSFVPFLSHHVDNVDVYKPVELIRRGVLQELYCGYLDYSVRNLGRKTTTPSSTAFHVTVTGPTATVEEMVQTTTRGLLVTRLSGVSVGDSRAWMTSGATRDGLWLVEHGKITRPCKNLKFRESVMAAFNRIDQLGAPVRAFRPDSPHHPGLFPVVVPAMKIRDFNFTALVDAV